MSTTAKGIPPVVKQAAADVARNILSLEARKAEIQERIEALTAEMHDLPLARETLIGGLRALVGADADVFLAQVAEVSELDLTVEIPEGEVVDIVPPPARVEDTGGDEPEPEPAEPPKDGGEPEAEAPPLLPDDDITPVVEKAKELGIFNQRRLADALGMSRSRVGDIVRQQIDPDPEFERTTAKGGPGVFWWHQSYTGPKTALLASGRESWLSDDKMTLPPSMLLAWINDNAPDRPFESNEAIDSLKVGRSPYERALNTLIEKGDVRRLKLGTYALSSLDITVSMDRERLVKWFRHAYPSGYVELKDVQQAFPDVHESMIGDALTEAVRAGELVRPKLGVYYNAEWTPDHEPPKKKVTGVAKTRQQTAKAKRTVDGSSKVTDRQFRDWIVNKHSGDRFTIRDMLDDLPFDSTEQARDFAAVFVNRGIIREKKGGEYEYVPPPAGPRERRRGSDPEAQTRGGGNGGPVATTGRTKGRSQKSIVNKRRAARGHRIPAQKGKRK